ncbi:MAG: sugar phosphate isomerase/epimerase family protein [Tepidisphaeraceae bacterium]
MNLGGHDIGICSWSLNPASTSALIDALNTAGLRHVQLALAPLLDLSPEDRQSAFDQLASADIAVTAGMIGFAGENYGSIASIRKTGGFVPGECWPERRERALAAGRLAAEMGVPILTTHPGFVPPSGDPAYEGIVARISDLAEEFDRLDVKLCLETGQEKARELLQFLNDLNMKNVGINFDPANMILYGAGDPVEAVATVGRHIRHVHIKDALASAQPGVEWGKEVPFGKGDLNVHAFLRALADVGYEGPLVIERETGVDQMADIEQAVDTLQAHLGE